MTAFSIVAAILVTAALAWVLRPLLGKRRAEGGPARAHSNLSVLRHQLAELEADRAGGTLSDEQFSRAKEELEARVLDEVRGATIVANAAPRLVSWTAGGLGLALPAVAVALYLALGNPSAFSPQKAAVGGGHAATPEELEAMVARLAARLDSEPGNAEGWGILARSYYYMQRYPEAVSAFAKLIELVPDDADSLADYADALAMTQGRQISGNPLELVKRALSVDPNHWKALAMAGTEAFDRRDYKAAVAYWEKAQLAAPPDSDVAKSIADGLAEARELGAIPARVAQSAPVAGVNGTVTLSPELAAKASPEDTLFIFARAAQGPRMPLAVITRRVKDLPVKFALDDSQAMAPGMKLSSFTEVVIGARISKSANATTQPGDLQGQSTPVKVGATGVTVVIDRVAP